MPEARSGLLLLDKPAGVSSFGAIARLRPILGRKVGHAGTLDPFATGLLLVLCGRATRLAPFLSGLDKRYRGTVRFGATSSTDDPEGELHSDLGETTEAAVRAALPAFRGRLVQVPPAASAVHVDGERAYRRFRRGEAVAVPARTVHVHRLELVAFDAATNEAVLDVHCGSGTYVRSLARDLGAAVGVGAYLRTLRRTHVGAFAVRDAASVEDVLVGHEGAGWLEPAEALAHLPVRRLDAVEATALSHGRTVARGGASGRVRCLHDDQLVAVGEPDGDVLRPVVVLGAA